MFRSGPVNAHSFEREAARLAALASYDVLDTPRERDFDDVAELASQICGTPVAVVNLIGEGRQFFKAEVGLGVRETPLDTSFCARAILEDEFLLVPDATKDARFACNPLVTGEPHLRFYAGALLKTDEGHALGTVCVLDYAPRELTELQAKTLRLLARQVMKQLELRLSLRRLADSNARAAAAQAAGRIGTFELDVATGVTTGSPELCRLFGLAVAPTYPESVLEALVVPDDAGVRSDAASRHDGSAPVDVEYRIRRADDGRERWISRRAQFVRDGDGRVVTMFGTVHDVSERKVLQVHTAALLDLGDRLRLSASTADVASVAAEVLGRTLGASRAGYARADGKGDLLQVEQDWTGPGAPSLRGSYDLALLGAALPRRSASGTMVVESIGAAASGPADGARSAGDGGTQAEIKLPLTDKGRLVGLLFVQADEARAWTGAETDFAQGVADRTYAALAKIQAEADQRLLNEELSHRMKNTMAMIQAIAVQTLKTVTDRKAVAVFMERLLALSRAHEVLLQQNWAAAPMGTIVAVVLDAFGQPQRFHVSGPDVTLGPRSTLSLSLVLHELTTNAIKYGALSTESGHVRVAWRLDGDGREATLTLGWTEAGGPPATEPTHRGLGSRLIRAGLVGTGGVELRYSTSGFEAEMRAPLDQVQLS